MEGGKRSGGSFTSDLFGSKEEAFSSSSPSSPSGIFASIFAPNSTQVLGREALRYDTSDNKKNSAIQARNAKPGAPDANPWNREGKNHGTLTETSSFYSEQSVQPCHLSSSIFYGGQDIFPNPQTTQRSSIYYGGQDIYANPQPTRRSGYSTFNKDGGEDDSGIASRGNWWQGIRGVYY